MRSQNTKTTIKAIFLALSIVLISACSVLTPKTAESVNQLVESQKYEYALALYSKLPPDQQLRIKLDKLMADRDSFESQVIGKTEKLRQQGAFYEAQDTLSDAVEKLPSSQKIIEAQKILLNARQQHHDRYQRQKDIAYAEYLQREAPILEALAFSDSRERSFQRYYKVQREKRIEFAEIVGSEGLRLAKESNYSRARQLLDTAESLNSDERWRAGLASVEQSESGVRRKQAQQAKEKQMDVQKAKTSAQEVTRQSIERLKAQFEQQFDRRNVLACQATLEAISLLDKQKLHVDWQKKNDSELKLLIQEEVQAALQKGQKEYSRGRIETAIATWKAAQAYAPDNLELQERIQRAEAFDARYKSLKK
mgnify:FL=1